MAQALPAEIYGAGLVFGRVGALTMVLPGLGEAMVPPRVRLAFALVLTLALYPVLRASLPPLPAGVGDMFGQLLIELIVGLALGTLIKMFMGALVVAGEVVSIQTTLAFSQTANPLQAQPTTSLTAFLSLLGVILVFATGLHHLFIGALVHSYTLFPAGKPLSIPDFTTLAIRTIGETFALGIQLSAPVLVFSLVFNVAAGFVGRMMPQFPIFFVVTPLSVLLGLSIFAIGLGLLGVVWVDRFRDFLGRLV